MESVYIVSCKLRPVSCSTLIRDFHAVGNIACLDQVVYRTYLFSSGYTVVFRQRNLLYFIYLLYHSSVYRMRIYGAIALKSLSFDAIMRVRSEYHLDNTVILLGVDILCP